jgi:putative flippase GtrA
MTTLRQPAGTVGQRASGGRQDAGARRLLTVEALKFVVVGALNTAVDSGLYLVLTRWLGLGETQVLAKAISYAAGTLNSFYWNRSWTFKSEASAARTLPLIVMANLIALGINAGLMHVGMSMIHVEEVTGLVIATAVTMSWNFVASKLIFARK